MNREPLLQEKRTVRGLMHAFTTSFSSCIMVNSLAVALVALRRGEDVIRFTRVFGAPGSDMTRAACPASIDENGPVEQIP